MTPFVVRPMTAEDVPGAVALQKAAFPPPFSEDLHWDPEHLLRHLELFPGGQWVAEADGIIVGSCSNCLIEEVTWQAHLSWVETVGGPYLANHRPGGSTLYGLDITVHPAYRKLGIGRAFYQARYRYVQEAGLARYGTGCRLPDYSAHKRENPGVTPEEYAARVVAGEATDRTLTPLLRYGLSFLDVVHDYMEDEESANCAALLEWQP